MLQQTRVETVIEYWNRWMAKFPTVEALAAASPDEVNQLWAGLGYYRRAQQLLKGAQVVMAEFGGVVPSSVEALLRIPGIGPYTAGAIASIAFDVAAPLVDGNVIRVLSRLYAVNSELGAAGGALEKRCWALAASLVDPEQPGAFNQSLMELGATVCKPTSPLCDSCPVRSVCKARMLVDAQRGSAMPHADLPSDVTYFPRKVPKKKAREVELAVAVISNSTSEEGLTRYLFSRRPPKGLLANQWEFPSAELPSPPNQDEEDEDDEDTQRCEQGAGKWTRGELLRPVLQHLADKLCVQFVPLSDGDSVALSRSPSMVLCESALSPPHQQHAPIVHVFSHQRHSMHVVRLRVGHVEEAAAPGVSSDASCGGPALRWMSAAEIVEAGITTGCKKVLLQVEAGGSSEKPRKSTAATPQHKAKQKQQPKDEEVQVEAKVEEVDRSTGSQNAFEIMRLAGASKAKQQASSKKAKLK